MTQKQHIDEVARLVKGLQGTLNKEQRTRVVLSFANKLEEYYPVSFNRYEFYQACDWSPPTHYYGSGL